MEGKIRIFISYSHKDKELVEKLVKIIEDAGMFPLWAKILPHGTGAAGTGFDEHIKIFIQHAHVFMPILFENSSEWVHQEIGYAKALHIPVLPITTEKINPGGMLQMNNALKLGDNEEMIKNQLTQKLFTKLIQTESPIAMYQRAAVVEDRAGMIRDYADKLTNLELFGVVRQKGGLSSFHIPDDIADVKNWTSRYFPETRSQYHKTLQWKERVALERHVSETGCKLIIKPSYAIKNRSPIAARTRLQTLIDFLKSKSDRQVIIAIENKQTDIESLTIVGDWFLAESVSFKKDDGFTNTFFTRNASEILERIKKFDSELNYLLNEWGWTESNSRKKAIEELTKLLETIEE